MKQLTFAVLLYLAFFNALDAQEKIHLITDRDIYSIGDELMFVAQIAAIDSTDSCEGSMQLLLLDGYGSIMSTSSYRIASCRFSGVLPLKGFLPDGPYTLIAYTSKQESGTPDQVFSKEIIVMEKGIPGLLLLASVDQDHYRSGDEVLMRVVTYFPDGQLAPRTSFSYDLMVNGETVKSGRGRTNREAFDEIELAFPEISEPALVHVEITAEIFGNPYTNSILIPSVELPVMINFYPEGGLLFEGLESQVAFTVNDWLGKPLAIKGNLVDQYGGIVQTIETTVPGLGGFLIKGDPAKPLSLIIEEPVSYSKQFPLPKIQPFGVRLIQLPSTESKMQFQVSINVEDTFIPVIAKVSQNGRELSKDRFYISKPRTINIPLSYLDPGLVQLSLIGEEGQALAQIEAFVPYTFKGLKPPPDISSILSPLDGNIQLTVASEQKSGFGPLCMAVVDDLFAPQFKSELSTDQYFHLGPQLARLPNSAYFFDDKQQLRDEVVQLAMLTHPIGNVDQLRDSIQNEVKADRFKALISAYFAEEPVDQLLQIIYIQQFLTDHFLKKGKERPTYLADNRMALEERRLVPLKLTQKERIQQELANGKSLASVLMTIKPYRVVNNQIVFRGPDSFNYQGGAVIIIDGINKGSNINALESVSAFDVENIRASSSISDVIKYTGMENSNGIVEITTKKGETELQRKDFSTYNPTIYWEPNFRIPKGGYIQITLPESPLESPLRTAIK